MFVIGATRIDGVANGARVEVCIGHAGPAWCARS
jgi:hypothetical protein